MRDLTYRQHDVLAFLAERAVSGTPPTVREICVEFDISSLRGCTVHLDALERKGMIKRGHRSREIALTDAGVEAVCTYRPHLVPNLFAYRLMVGWHKMPSEVRRGLVDKLRDFQEFVGHSPVDGADLGGCDVPARL